MITLVRLARRASALSVEDFQVQADVACAWPVLPELRRATQSLTRLGGYRAGTPIYDVVDELVFSDVDAAKAAYALPAFQAVWRSPLLDPASISTLLDVEIVAKDGPVPVGGVKNIEFVTRLPSMEHAAFDRYWSEVHGPLAAQIEPIRRYVQSHTVPEAHIGWEEPLFDGLALTWFDSVAAMREGATSAVYEETRADELNFLDGELPFIITTERLIVG